MASRRIEVSIIGDSKSLERAFGRASNSARGFNTSLGRSLSGARIAIAGAAIAAGGLAVASVKSAAAFETSMQRIVGLAGGAQSSIAGLSDEILALGPKVGKGPQELGDALYFVASAGIAVSKQMSVVKASARAAASGLGDTQTVADAVTSAMNAYGQANLSAAQAADVLAATVREGKGEAAAFAPVIGTVASIAAQLGVAFNEVGAALASQTKLGVSAETAAVQLQAVFSSLLKNTPKVAEAFASVGLSTKGLREELKQKGLLATLQTLKDSFGDNTAAMAQAFPNIRALRGLFALVGKNAEQTRAVFARMVDSTGSLDTAFGAISKTTTQRFARMSAAIEAAQIRIGAALAPVAEIVAKEVTKIANSLSKWLDNTENQRRVQHALNQTLGDAKAVIKGTRDVLVPLIGTVKAVADKMGGLRQATRLLIATFVAVKVVNFASAITGLGTQALVTTGRISALRLALLRLGAIGVIVLGVEVLINRRRIEKSVNDFLRDHAGFLANKRLTIGAGIDPQQLQNVRDQIAGVKGEGDLMVKALDAAIEKLRQLDKQKLGNVEAGLRNLQERLAGVKDKKVRVSVIEKGLKVLQDKLKSVRGKTLEVKVLESGIRKIKDDLKGVKNKKVALSVLATGIADIKHQLDGLRDKNIFVRIATAVTQATTVPTKHSAAGRGQGAQIAAAAAAKAAKVEKAAAVEIAAARKAAAGAAKKAAAAAVKAKEAAQTAFDALIDSLNLGLEKAQVTSRLGDDLRALGKIQSAIEARIKVEGRTTDLLRQLFQVRQQQAQLRQEQRAGIQFKALGLGSTGEAKIPSSGSLEKRLGALRDRIKGTFLDTRKTRSELQSIAKVLSGAFGKVGKDVRASILQMFNDLSSALQGGGKAGNLTAAKAVNTKKLLEGLGLSEDEFRAVRGRISKLTVEGAKARTGKGTRSNLPRGFSRESGGPVFIFNGDIITPNPEEFEKHVQRKARRSAGQRRGTKPGTRMGGV